MTLQDKALLVSLNIRQWTARKYDRKETQQLAALHGVSDTVGRYNKSLLPGAQLLADIAAKTTYIRKFYYDNTLPWGIEGTQILPSDNFFTFSTEFRKQKAEWEQLVNNFVLAYPQLMQDAQKHLKSMFNQTDYPDPSEIASKFGMELTIMPVPANDFRVSISEEAIAELKQDLEAKVQKASQNAIAELKNRLKERLEAMHKKLSDPSAIFRDSLVENTRELCSLIYRLNFSNDAELELARKEASALSSHHPETLRLDLDLRALTAKQAKEIADRL